MQATATATVPAPPPGNRVRAMSQKPFGNDPLDSIISPFYEELYAPRELRLAVAPLSLSRVTISRYYMREKIAVDFENPNRPFYSQEKRRWCHTRGIVYVPVPAAVMMTVDQFRELLAAETKALADAQAQTSEPAVPAAQTQNAQAGGIDDLLARPETVVGLEGLAAKRVTGLQGAAKIAKVASVRQELTSELTSALASQKIPATPEAVDAWISALG